MLEHQHLIQSAPILGIHLHPCCFEGSLEFEIQHLAKYQSMMLPSIAFADIRKTRENSCRISFGLCAAAAAATRVSNVSDMVHGSK